MKVDFFTPRIETGSKHPVVVRAVWIVSIYAYVTFEDKNLPLLKGDGISSTSDFLLTLLVMVVDTTDCRFFL